MYAAAEIGGLPAQSWGIPFANRSRRSPTRFHPAQKAPPHEHGDQLSQGLGRREDASNLEPRPDAVRDHLEFIVNRNPHRARVEGPAPFAAETEGLPEEHFSSERASPSAFDLDPIAVPCQDANPVRLFARVPCDVLIRQIRPPRTDGSRRPVDVQIKFEGQ
jgi:hypothetical protein